MHHYRAFGVTIASDLELLHLDPEEHDRVDVRIEAGDLGHLRKWHGLDSVDRAFLSTDEGVVMHWRDVGTVEVSSGERIVVDFQESVDPTLRTVALTGPPMGVLLEQRGKLVLHGSAVVMDSKAIAFLGHKGLGKSTTAAAMSSAGYPVLTDDILAIDVTSPTFPVSPGLPVVKLWPSSRDAIYGSENQDATTDDKQLRQVGAARNEFVPLGALFILDMGETGADSTTGKDAFLDLIRNSYSGRFTGSEGTSPEHFLRCSKVASSVPVFRLRRQPNLESLPEVVSVVERTVRSL